MTRRWPRRTAARAAIALGLAAAGFLLVTDRPGLATDYYAATPVWEGEPVATRVTHPTIGGPAELTRYLHDRDYCSLAWRGSVQVEAGGEHRFRLRADETAYLRLDGETVVETADGRPGGARVRLAAGLHRLEIGLAQTGGPLRLEVLWTPPGASERLLDPDLLFAGAAPAPRRWARRLLAGWPPLARRLAGAALLLAALLTLRALPRPRLPRRLDSARTALARFFEPAGRRRAAWLVFLAGLGLVVYRLFERAAGSPFGYDDTRYMSAAADIRPIGWLADRYTHIYLVRLFQELASGDLLAGAEAYWAFVLAVTVIAIAVAIRSLGPGHQLTTLGATLVVLCGQRGLLRPAGTIWADYTAMMFFTAAVAVYLHRLTRERGGGWEWHAPWIGALTFAAIRAKPTAAVLLWLLVLLLWEKGRFDPRGFARRLGLWLVGLVAAAAVLAALDASLLGDPLFSIRAGPLEQMAEVHLADEPPTQRDLRWVWIDQVWPAFVIGRLWIPELLPLGLLVVAAAFAAGATRQRIELRLLHLLPIAYLGALIALQLRGTYGALTRHLFPIVPTAVLLGGALFHYAGIDRLTLRRLAAPRVVAPLFALAALTLLVLLPALHGGLGGADLAAVERLGFASSTELATTLVWPALLALLALIAPLLWADRAGRALLPLAALLLALAPSLAETWVMLETRREAQRSALLLLPWRAFGDELAMARRVTVPPHLAGGPYGMFGPPLTMSRIATLALGRPYFEVVSSTTLSPPPDAAIADAATLARWRRRHPEIDATLVTEPSGRLFLVRPKRALAARAPPSAPQGEDR